MSVIPRCVKAHEGMDDLGPLLHGQDLVVEQDLRRGVVRVRVERPLVGLRYLIQWWLPES